LHLGNASRHRRIEHRGSKRTDALRELTARARADRAHVDPDLRLGEAGEYPIVPRRHAFEYVVVGKRRDQDVGGFGDFARRIAPLQPFVDELVGVAAFA